MKKFLICLCFFLSGLFLVQCSLISAPDPPSSEEATQPDRKLYFSVVTGGVIETAKEAIQEGANLDCFSGNIKSYHNGYDYKNPIRIALIYGGGDVPALLLEAGANSNYVDSDGLTVLMDVASQGNYELIKKALECGGDISLTDPNGYTALDHVVTANVREQEFWKICDLFFEYGASFSEKSLDALLESNLYGYQKFARAAKIKDFLKLEEMTLEENSELKKAILGGVPNISQIEDELEKIDAVHYTASCGNLNTLKEALKQLPDIESYEYDESVVASAASSGNMENLKYLVEQGYSINMENVDWQTPLSTALYFGQCEAAQFLLEKGANPGTRILEAPKLCWGDVTSVGDQQALEFLINNFELDYYAKRAAMGGAASNNQTEILKYLISIGIDVNMEIPQELKEIGTITIAYSTPIIECAQSRKGTTECAKILFENGAKPIGEIDDPLRAAALSGNYEVAKLLIEYGAQVASTEVSFNTPLADAISEGNLEFVKLLVENGANLETPEGDSSLLMFSIYFTHSVNIATYLVECGIDINYANEEGNTALITAVHQDTPDIAAMLIKHGADYTMKNADGETALDLALKHGNPYMIDALKQSIIEMGGDPEQAITKKSAVEKFSESIEDLLDYVLPKEKN